MIDIELIREQADLVKAGLVKRNMEPALVDRARELDSRRRELLVVSETLKAERNKASKEIGASKDKTAREGKIAAMREVGDKIAALEKELAAVDAQLNELMSTLPNLVEEKVPAGGEEANLTVKEWGDKPKFDFEPKAHWDLGPALGIINFDQGTALTGSRFYVLSGAGARLQRSITHISRPCTAWRSAETRRL